MADTPTATPTVDELQASVSRLEKALAAERDAHKSTRAGFLAPVRAALGLGDDAALDAVTAALSTRLGDADKIVAERTNALTAERDSARAELEQIRAERNAERTERAIGDALAKSGIIAHNADDAASILRGVLEVTDKGEVRTKAAPNIVPGQTPEQFIAGQLRTLRPHYWPASVGGGAKGTGTMPTPNLGNDSCFDPRSPQFNVTAQFQYEARFGKAAADAALKKYGRGAR